MRWTEADVTVAVPVEGGVALATTPLTPPTGHFPWWAGALIWLFGIGVAAALGRNPVAGLLAIGAGAAVLGPPLAALAAGGAALLVLRPTSRIVGHARHDAAPYLYALPAVLGLAVLIMIPFVVGVGMAFFRHRHGEWSFVGLSHFAEILAAGASGDTRFWWTLFVTFLWTAVNVVLHVSIGLSLALLLKDGVGRLTPVYRVLLVLPWAIPNYITALTWKGMFNKEFGAVNAALALVGAGPVDWLGSTFLPAFTANVITNTWLGFPFMMVVSLGALQSIPAELYEAAEVDGASRWTRFRTITLPLLKPALFPAVILGSIWTFNMFNVIYLVSGGGPNGETDILITEAYRAFRVLGRYGYAASYSTMIFLILLGYTLITNRVTKATEGAFD